MIKRELYRAGAACVMIAVAALAGAWWGGWFDITGIARDDSFAPARVETEQVTTQAETEEITEPPEIVDEPEDDNNSPTPDTTTDTTTSGTAKQLVGSSIRYDLRRIRYDTSDFTLPSDASLRSGGYYFTDSVYSASTHALAEVTSPFKLTTVFSNTERTVSTPVYVTPDSGDSYVEYTQSTEQRPALEPYMGYIIYDYKGTLYLLDSQGNALLTFSEDEYAPAYTRDSAGNPLFVRDVMEAHTTATGETYYVTSKSYFRLSDDKKSFVAAEYNDTAENRGLYFDYPASFGQADNSLVRLVQLSTVVTQTAAGSFAETIRGTWAFAYSATSRLTNYRYARAYNFSEGYAAVEDTNGEAYFINSNGTATFTSHHTYQNSSGRYVISRYLMPLSTGIESLGYFYFDHGLVRVREQIIDNYNYTYRNRVLVVSDDDYLIYPDGSRFDIPQGYNIVSYSDGIILLEKDGKYGFMNHSGAWIAQPIYSVATPFVDGLATIGHGKSSTGIIDTSGSIVLPLSFDFISPCSSGVITAYSSTQGWKILNLYRK